MEIKLQLPEDNNYAIPYCNVMHGNDCLHNIAVPCEIITEHWIKYYNSAASYSLEVEIIGNTPIVNNCDIEAGTITISGNSTHTRNIFFSIDRAELQNNVHEISYTIKLLKGDSIVAKAVASLHLNREDVCTNCRSFYNDKFCKVVPNEEILYYSDKNHNNKKLHIANLHINCERSHNFNIPNNIDITYTVRHNEDYYNMADPISLNLADGLPKIVPLFIDMTCFSCPEDESGNLAIKVSCRPDNLCNNMNPIEYEKHIPFCRDGRYNKLAVFIRDGDIEFPILRGSDNHLSDIILQNAVGHIGEHGIEKHIVFKNLANEAVRVIGDNGIRVKDLKIEVISDLDRIEGASEGELREIWDYSEDEFLLPASDAERTHPIKYNFSKIKNIRCVNHSRILEWKMRISFKYWEDRYGHYVDTIGNEVIELMPFPHVNQWKTFNATLSTNLHRCPPSCYYSVDLGTSAVVAYKMSRDIVANYTPPLPVDLKTIKNNLLLAQYPDDENKRKDNSENAENIIASTLYLNHLNPHPGNAVNLEYKNMKLWFSPSSEMTRPDCLYPCLKYMVGNNSIPPIPAPVNMSRGNIPQDVQAIIKTAYEQLCRLYLQNETTAGNNNNAEHPIEALVLTVPNSFTPIHIEQIRKAVMDNIPTLADEMLEFVSESDSVLCSYISDTHNNGALIQKRKAHDGEHILIYDMGAGTLDVTYAKCHTETAADMSERTCVEIIAKKGVNKAGDYIDYLLGEIILDLLEKHKVNTYAKQTYQTVLSTVPNAQGINYRDLRNLKNYLRNKVKPNLSASNADATLPATGLSDRSRYKLFNIPEISELGEIKFKDILEHDKFKSYIQSCTNEIIKDLTASYGTDMGLGKRKILLDTVILSGRMSSLEAISDSLKKSIRENTPQKAEVSYIESVGNNVSKKTVVAKGALDYIRLKDSGIEIKKKPIYGKYGLIIRKANGASVWMLLADESACLPVSRQLDIDLGGANQVQLVHSCSHNPSTDSNRIILHRLEITSIPNNLKRASFTINEDTTVSYIISNSDGTNPVRYNLHPHDDYYSEDLRRSLWPVIYFN